MCGIAGFFSDKPREVTEANLERMLKRIEHRGPDGEGRYMDDRIALGHRRLSIIDIEGGSQPIYNEDGTKVIIYNGEIYNYKELREELLTKGHTFKTASDTEVILHGYEEYGEKFLDRLRGMFAFVIWDRDKSELFGARDHFGIKPFYYYHRGDSFMFASEIKAFLDHDDFVKEFNRDMLSTYLSFSFTPGTDTFFKNVYKLEPGCYFRYKDNKLSITRYFELSFEDGNSSYEEVVAEIGRAMEDSVKMHQVSDVEVGSFLSSGVDSSYIVSLAHPDKTYTIGSSNPKFDESKYARELADKLGITNADRGVERQEFFDILPKILYQFDEPVADPSAVALYFLAELASRDVKVVLSGEGADEFFGGYRTYRRFIDDRFYTKLPFAFRKVVGKLCGLLPPHRGINFLVRNGKPLEEDYIGIVQYFTEKEVKRYINFKSENVSYSELTAPVYRAVAGCHPVTKMQAVDIRFWMVGDILQKADKMTMAHSIEARVPFVDKEVYKLARTIPYEYRITKEGSKVALRQAAKADIPTEAYNNPKLPFPVPLREWLFDDDIYALIREQFDSDISRELFNHKRIVKVYDEYRKGKRTDYKKIWGIYCFLVWYRECFVKM